MTELTREQVLGQLKKVKGPDLESNIVDLGMVSEIFINGGEVAFAVTVDADRAQELEPMREAAAQAVERLDGVDKVMVALTADRAAGSSAGSSNGGAAPRRGPPPGEMAPPPPMQAKAQAQGEQARAAGVPGVQSIIAVASGKGGVGKSTTAANLALGLSAIGLNVGVLDADIYGPSMPRLLGITGRPQAVDGRILNPLEGYGLKVMSMGFLVEEDTPMIWRGPMVMSALSQMLREVAWGELDILVVDMPPGTGDAQLTMAQQVPLAGAVIVSTPQDLALIDARKGLNMFRKVDVPVLGIVENMSYFSCPKCGERSEIFGHGGARVEAEKLGVPFLGEVPLDMEVRLRSDQGQPIVVSVPDSLHANIYRTMASDVWKQIEEGSSAGVREAPSIVIE